MKSSFNTVLILSIISIIGLQSCNKDDLYTPNLKYDYYPLEVGHWIEYEVDSFFFFDVALPQVIKDTISFQIREVITSTFVDGEGRETYRIERFKRKSENVNWVIDRVWSLNRTNFNLQKVEDDLRFIKLIFPPEVNKTWDGNAYISSSGHPSLDYLSEWEYRITDLDVSNTVNNLSFDTTMTIVQVDKENLIEKTYSIEQYALDVGLIYKELQVLFKQNVNVGWDQPEFGIIVRHTITDYKGR